ncbi:jerky protein homolog [Impatiens glandulifera]|uniref:jerky protein homolog n=1 Tax=Impatiens glandulifera TaxID=253017 RepID=UPI001FB09FCE|nr:jerky protein homolog [Impatiens glandulifera]
MTSHLKGVKKTTVTDEIRRELCKHNKDNPSLTQKQLQEWVHSNYGLQKEKKFMKDMYLVDAPYFTFSIGWLGKFKARYGIKNFWGFGESGSVEMEGLFFRLQSDHSLATMQFEGKNQDNERLTVAICCNEDGSKKFPLWLLGNMINQAWTMDVRTNTIANYFRHCKLRSTDNVTFENSNEDGESTQEL